MPNTLYEGEKWDKTKKVIKTGYDKTKKHLSKLHTGKKLSEFAQGKL